MKINQIKRNIFNQLLFIGICTILAGNVFAEEQGDVEKIRYHKVITIKAAQLSSLNGKPFDQVTLVSLKNGILEPIPFQFDEFAENDYVHIPTANTTLKGVEGVF